LAGFIITCDGGYRKLGKKPGVATYACLVRRQLGEVYRESGVVCQGRSAHSFMAEYAAIVAALRWLRRADLPPRSLIVVQSDCRSVVDRINGHCPARRKHGVVMLHRLALAAALALNRRGHWVVFRHVPRTHVAVRTDCAIKRTRCRPRAPTIA
jgi:ribonuclease HI